MSAQPRIMLSYRRSDSAGITGRIFDRLAAHFGPDSLFMDIDAIPLGVDFHKYIDDALKTMDYVLAIVGPNWLGSTASGTMRLTDPSDPVRIELETALRNGTRIVPVLVEGSKMPARADLPESLADIHSLNAARVNPGIDFDAQVDRLIRSLEGSKSLGSTAGPFTGARQLDNLPKRQSLLIGRTNEVAAIESFIQETGFVTVTGSGGVGKTRVALKVASDLRNAYVDGAWFVDLAPIRTAGLVAAEIAAAIGLSNSKDPIGIASLVQTLVKRDLLLVIDNCEHLIDEAATAIETIVRSCPNIRVLATSREPLAIDGEKLYRLPSLDVPALAQDLPAVAAAEFASISLFVDRTTSVDSSFILTDANAPIVAEICARLDGIPLAIELAAARASLLGLTELRDRLNERFQILTHGRRTALLRQQTMRATIDWSFDLLTEPERVLFRRLAVFSGFTLAGAAELSTDQRADRTDVADDLASLVSKSLVHAESVNGGLRYRLLESTREYALDKLRASPEQHDVERRFARWCARFVETAHARWETLASRTWLAQTKPEIENLRSALVWALEKRNDIATGQQIAANGRRFWGRLAPLEGKRWLQVAEDSITQDTPKEVVASLWLSDAHVHIALQEYKRAHESAERATRLFAEMAESSAYWEAYGFDGCALTMLGRGEEAEPLLLQALEAHRRSANVQLTAAALVDLAFLKLMRDDKGAARDLFEEALSLYRDVGNEQGARTVSINLAEIAFRSGNNPRAIEYAESALQDGDDERTSGYLVNLAAYLVAAGQWAPARDRAREALSRFAISRTELETLYALQHLAAVAALQPNRENPMDDQKRAARLLGFVDHRLAALDCGRELMEQREYDAIVKALRTSLGDARYDRLHAQGAEFDESLATSEARLV